MSRRCLGNVDGYLDKHNKHSQCIRANKFPTSDSGPVTTESLAMGLLSLYKPMREQYL